MQVSDITGNVVLTDAQADELSVQLQSYKNSALYYHEGELATKTLEAWKYYYGELPEPITKGSSKWIDRSVWESVNGSLQELISVFTSGEDAVRFAPSDSSDSLGAEAATKAVNKAVLSDNNGYRIFHDSFKEACVVRNAWIKRYWKTGTETVTETFNDLSTEQFEFYVDGFDEKDVIDMQVCGDDETELLSGKITFCKEYEGVEIEYVPFEQVIIEPTARSVVGTNYLGHRVRKTKHDLLDMGFDAEIVEELQSDGVEIDAGVIASARFNEMSPISVDDDVNVGDGQTDRVWLYENYIRTSVITGVEELLQVFTVNDQILEINRVSEIPFETFTPFPIPGNVYGESVTDITKDIQELNTSLVRGIVDNTMNANFRRYVALKGGYDRRSLLDNRPGGVVEVNSVGAVTPFPYHSLPQGVTNLLEYTEQKKEGRTGVTRLGQGLDPNVFKNDNANATVNMMMSAAQNRLRMIARNVAEEGMKSLMLSVYRLIRENGKKPIVVETAKGPFTLIPNQLPKRDKMIVAVAVGSSERKERAQTLATALQAFQNSPVLGKFMLPDNAYYLGTQLLESMGLYDVQNYITPPEQLPPPQPDPMQQLNIQAAAEQIKNVQAQTQKVISEITEAQQKLRFEQVKTADEFSMKREESASKQDEAADKMSIEERRLTLEARKLQLAEAELELKRQEILIEAQLEAQQKRSVGLGNN